MYVTEMSHLMIEVGLTACSGTSVPVYVMGT